METPHQKKNLEKFFSKIYFNMFIGLLLTGFISFLTITYFKINPIVLIVLAIVEIIIVFFVMFRHQRLEPNTIWTLFFIYSILNGITLSLIFLMYDVKIIFYSFIITSIMYLFLALIGMKSKKDFSSWGKFLMVSVIGVIIMSIVNIFLKSSGFDFLISIITIVVFSFMIVYDNNKYKNLFKQITDKKTENKLAALGSLIMYINFIVLFTHILRILARLNSKD